jgi:phage FluMu protein Com
MKDARLVKILVEEKALVKLLKTIGQGREYPTRELLTKLGAYGYGHKLLLKAQKRGLVERKTVKNKVFNKLTSDGKKIVMIAKEIGV